MTDHKEAGNEDDRPCIMPECPYCPACKYGLVDSHADDPAFSEWICCYDPAEDNKN